MIIEQIELKNYRQYKEKTVINFGYSKQKNVNIVVGSNGAGKTNISNALQWCFYGKEPSLKPGIEFGILNMEVFEGLNEKAYAEVLVKVTFRIGEGETYSIERRKTISKINNEQIDIPFSGSGSESDGSMLRAYFFPSKKIRRASYDTDFPITLINSLAPEKISEYFFFNGEKLENYFKASSNDKIKKSIFKISQLDLLGKIEKRLDNMINEYRDESRRNSPDLDRVNSEIEKLQDELNYIKKDLTENFKGVSRLKEERVDFLEKYQRLGGESVKKLLEDNKKTESELDNLRDELQEKEDEKSNFLLGSSYLFLINDAFKNSLDLFKDARKRKIIPPNIDPNFVAQLLKTGKCICGTDIKKHSKEGTCREQVKQLLKRISVLGSRAVEMVKIESDIDNIVQSKYKSIAHTIKLYNDSITKMNERIDELEKKYNENNIKIGEAKLDKMESFKKIIDDLNNAIEKASGIEAVLKEKKKITEEDIKKQKEDFIRLNKKWEKGRYINKCVQFCENAQKSASKIKRKIMHEIRKEISCETEQHYQELHWKEGENINISIDENYKISAMQRGYNKFGAFSAGEDALLAMSFIFALNSVSGFNTPIILDTALGRIDPKPRANFAKNISNYLEKNQIILLFTQAEYTPEVKSNLSAATDSEYWLDLKTPWSAKIDKIK